MQCSTFSEQEYNDKQLIEEIINYQQQLKLQENEKAYVLTILGTNSDLIQTYAKRIKTIYNTLTSSSQLQMSYQENVLQLSNLLKNGKANDRLQISMLIYELKQQVQQLLNKTNTLRQQTKYPCDIHNFIVNEISTYQQLYNDNIITAADLPQIYQSIGLDFDLHEDELIRFLKNQLPKFRQIDLFLAQPQNSVLTLLHNAINSIRQAFYNDNQVNNMSQYINMYNFKKMLNTEQQLKKAYQNQKELADMYNTTIMKVPLQIDYQSQVFECVSSTLKKVKVHRNIMTRSKAKDIDMDVTQDTNTDIDELDDEELRKQLKEQQQKLKIIDLNADDEVAEKFSQIITLSHSKSNILSNFSSSQLILSNQGVSSLKEIWRLLNISLIEQEFLTQYLSDNKVAESNVIANIDNYIQKLKNILDCRQKIILKSQQLDKQIEEFNSITDNQLLFRQFMVIQALFFKYCMYYQEFHTITCHYASVNYQLYNVFNVIYKINIKQLCKMIQWLDDNNQINFQNKEDIQKLFQYCEKKSAYLIHSLIYGQTSSLNSTNYEIVAVINALISQLTQLDGYEVIDNSIYQYIINTFYKRQKEYIKYIIQNKNKYICHAGALNEKLQAFDHPSQAWAHYNEKSLAILQKFEMNENEQLSFSNEQIHLFVSSSSSVTEEVQNLYNNFMLSFNKSDSPRIYQRDKILINTLQNNQQNANKTTADKPNLLQKQNNKRRCCQ